MPLLSIQQLEAVQAIIAAKLPERVAALERQLAAGQRARGKSARAADAERLREQIREILSTHPDPGRMSAKEVLRAMEQRGTASQLALRTLRWHIREIRRESGNGNEVHCHRGA